MHKFQPETLELFRSARWSTHRHLDSIANEADKLEIQRVRELVRLKNIERKMCSDCDESMAKHGSVCLMHYHDYCLCYDDSCWTCYVERVREKQLGMPSEMD